MGVFQIREPAQMCENWKMLAGKTVKVKVGKDVMTGEIPLEWWKSSRSAGVGESGFAFCETVPLVMGDVQVELQVREIERVEW